MSEVPVTLRLNTADYRAVAAIASAQGVNAHTLIEQLVAAALRPKITKLTQEQLLNGIVRLHGRGYNDREIADHLGVHRERVRTHRHRLRLPANDARGGGQRTPINQKESS